jgi:polyhydroxybutyrate depolymerase
MAFRLASRRSEKFAAIAAVSGLYLGEDIAPTRPVPTLFIIGSEDPLLPLGGGTAGFLWLQRTTPPVNVSLAGWAVAMGCDVAAAGSGGVARPADPAEWGIHAPNTTAQVYEACETEFVAILLGGHGHRWAGGGTPSLSAELIGPSRDDISATEIVAEFLLRHSLALRNPP